MRAMLCHKWGDPEDLRLTEVDELSANAGEVVVAVAAAGLNFADTLMISGRYQEKPALPFAPGLEAAGRVKSVGPDVTRVKPGDRVMILTDHGAFADEAKARESDVFPIPETMNWHTAAGFPITYGTAHGALRWHARLAEGETLLVHGAAGGVGLAAVEIGKAMGARVIATAGGKAKLDVAKAHGADDLIDYRLEDIRERVKSLTGGHGADVVFDPVGGDVFDASLRCIAWGGRLLVIGFASGRVPKIPANILLVKNIAAMGIYWGSYRRKDPDKLKVEFRELFDWFQAGSLKPHVHETFPLIKADVALRLLTDRKASGKVVLTCDESI